MFATSGGLYVVFSQDCCAQTRTAENDCVLSGFHSPPISLLCAHLGPSRVRIHDLRTDKIALSLSAHQLGVSAVQMDDWKIVSGGEEGLVSVWDYRMSQKLWEVHSR